MLDFTEVKSALACRQNDQDWSISEQIIIHQKTVFVKANVVRKKIPQQLRGGG